MDETTVQQNVPLVLVVDDAQWGDDDSGALLGELLRPPEAPALCCLAIFRSQEQVGSPLLRRLSAAREAAGGLVADLELETTDR